MNKESNNGTDEDAKSTSDLIEYWTKKETSCDIELDTTGTITIKLTSQTIIQIYSSDSLTIALTAMSNSIQKLRIS